MKAVIEGLLFVSGEDGLTLEEICKITEKEKDEIKSALDELYNEYTNSNRGITMVCFGEHYKLTTKKEHNEYYKKMALEEENSTLSNSALETLAIIAYNAPLTRVEVDNIRGVNSSYVIRKLLLKGLIEEVGRSELPGRPLIYNVTSKFLDYFGLTSTDELPKIKVNEQVVDDEKQLFESKYTEN